MTVFDLVSDVVSELVKEGYGVLGQSIFLHEYRPSPKNQIAVRLIPGLGPMLASGSSTARPKIQIYVLNEKLSLAASKADAIRDHFLNQVELIGQGIWGSQDCPIGLGLDEKIGSYIYVVEFQVFGEEAS